MFVCGSGRRLEFLTPADLELQGWCCMGDAEDGPASCTCWEPVYDAEQQTPNTSIVPATRRARCGDCAFRPDSPERAEGMDLEGLPNFWCHQGIRRPVAMRHPDGRVREVHDSADYQPPMIDGTPYKADGSPADRCAGWARAKAHEGVASGA